MVRRNRTQLCRQFGTAQLYDLIRMELQLHAHFLCPGQQPPGLLNRKHVLLTENIAELRQLSFRHNGQHLLHQVIHELVFPAFVVLWHRMGT